LVQFMSELWQLRRPSSAHFRLYSVESGFGFRVNH
jgi:hypothetical protein